MIIWKFKFKKKKNKKRFIVQFWFRGGKIRHDPQTKHDIKLTGYKLKLNGFVSYSG